MTEHYKPIEGTDLAYANIETLMYQELKRPATDEKQREARRRRDALLAASRTERGARELEAMLRHHSQRTVAADETWVRDAFDECLAYYSMLEIAIEAGYLPPELPDDVAGPALEHLSDPAMRRYYEYYYPLVLPQALRYRLEGTRALEPEPADAARPAFLRFLSLNPMLYNADADAFMWLLDNGVYKYKGRRINLSTAMEELETPERFFAAVLRSTSDPQDRALRGLLTFIAFSQEFERLLADAAETPLLQSSMWHYRAYWYTHLRAKIGVVLDKTMDTFEAWVPASDSLDEKQAVLAREVARELGGARKAIHRLTSPVYRVELEYRLFSERWGRTDSTDRAAER